MSSQRPVGEPAGARRDLCRLFVGNIGHDLSESALLEFFVARGLHVTNASVVVDRATGYSRGFGFVEIEGAGDADAAIASLDGAAIQGRELTIRRVGDRGRFR